MDFISLAGKFNAVINPGLANPPNVVFIEASIKDPVTFGDVNTTASFGLPTGNGLDYSLSLLNGTRFPPNLTGLGSSITLSERLAPGVIHDPNAFFDTPSGFIDLYKLTIDFTPDRNVLVDLTLGRSTSDFTLDFKNHLGLPFDPNDEAQVNLIESAIANAFADNLLANPLNNVLTVGFVPREGLTGFSIGNSDTLNIAGPEPGIPEIPEPSTWLMTSSGVAVLLWLRRRQNFIDSNDLIRFLGDVFNGR